MRYFYISSLLAFLFCQQGFSQAEIDIGEVLIESESIQTGMMLRKESVAGTYIIPRADLLSFGYSTAGDVLKNLPLVYLDSDPGVNRNVSIGGLDREYQSILINGKKPAGGEDARDLKLDRIPVSMIERIEIQYNSPVSAGSSGIAGTVNIILKENSAYTGLSAHLETNISTTDPKPGIKTEIEGSANLGKTIVFGGLTYNSYRRIKETDLFDSSTDISGGIEEEIVTDIFGANLNSTRNAGKNGVFKMNGFFSWFDEDEFESANVKRRKDGTLNVRQSDTENDKLRYLITYDLQYHYQKDRDQLKIQAGYSNNFEKRHKDQLQEKSEYFEEVKEVEDQNNHALDFDINYIRQNLIIGSLESTFRTGLAYSINLRNTDRYNASRPEGYLLWDMVDESYSMDENILSAFGELTTRLSPRAEMLYALIYEHSYGGYETTDTIGTHLFSHLSPSVHLKYSLSESFILNTGLARHIARPAFMSMVPIEILKIKKDLIELGNPDLSPSKAYSIDLGASYYINSKSYLSVSAYYKWVRDMIQMQYIGIDQVSGYNLYKFINIDKANLYGFYLDTKIDLNPDKFSGFSIYASYSYMGSETDDEFTGGTKRLDNQPAHLVNLKLDYLDTDRRINVSLGANYNSMRIIAPFRSDDGADISETRESGYLTLAARLKYFIGGFGSIYLAGDNLLMQEVKIEQGSVTEKFFPGAFIRVGLNFNFRGSRK